MSIASRLAWREVSANRGRSILIGVLVALPVLLACASSVWFATMTGTTPEREIARALGTHQARVSLPVGASEDAVAALASAASDLGGLTEHVGEVEGSLHGIDMAFGLVTADAADPHFQGRWLVSGNSDRVLLTAGLMRDLGVDVGGEVVLGGRSHEVGGTFAVKGVAWPGVDGVLVPPGHALAQSGTTNLFPKSELTDAQIQGLQAHGLEVTTASQIEALVAQGHGEATVQTLIGAVFAGLGSLVVGSVAAAAFTISIRSQRRVLALLSATGAPPGMLKQVLVRSGMFIGTIAVAGGTLLGVLGGAAAAWWMNLRDPVPGFTVSVRWEALLLFAALGLASSWLAVWLPARSVARQDVITALADSEAPMVAPVFPRRSIAPFTMGAVVVLAGVWQSRMPGDFPDLGRTLAVAMLAGGGGAVLWFVAAVWAMPWLVEKLSRLTPSKWLGWRLALRDAARSGRRAVALVAASASAVTLGALALTYVTAVGNQELDEYRVYEPLGIAQVQLGPDVDHADFVAGRSRSALVSQILGAPRAQLDVWGPRVRLMEGEAHWYASPLLPEDPNSWSSSGILVGGTEVLEFVTGRAATVEELQAIDDGVALVFDPQFISGGRTLIEEMDFSGSEPLGTQHELDARYVEAHPGMYVVVPPQTAEAIGMPVAPMAVWLDYGDAALARGDVQRASRAVFSMGGEYLFSYEGGPYSPALALVPSLVATVGGAAVAVAVVAMVLAVGEGRATRVTLATIGATTGLLRRAATSQAVVCVVLGGLVGAVVGAVPIAIVFASSEIGMGPIPWLPLGALAFGPAVAVACLAAVVVRPAQAQMVRGT